MCKIGIICKYNLLSRSRDMFSNTYQMSDSEVINSVVDRHRFDVDPFWYRTDLDPDLDPDSTRNFTHSGGSKKLLGFHSQQSQRTLVKFFRQRHRCQSSSNLDSIVETGNDLYKTVVRL
jgi:hypothetical protein